MFVINDKKLSLQVLIMTLILVGMIIITQLTVVWMTETYKKIMVVHDTEIAGYLLNQGMDAHQIAMAFTDDKTANETKMGAVLLKNIGYRESMNTGLVPSVKHFYRKFALVNLFVSSGFSIFLLIVFSFFALQREKQYRDAGTKIQRFMDGDITVRLEDSNDDSLSMFFAKVNIMATALTAHLEKEKNNRLFLKTTISDIFHQLKTPLTALQMYNEIILDEKIDNPVVASFSQKSQRELLRMENLIQNLLKLAKLDAGTIDLEKSRHQLREFLEKCQAGFITRAAFENKKIKLDCDNLISLCCDEIWLGEAVQNIIKNALDHTKATDQIEISGRENSLLIEIIIKDNGLGIDPADIHHIFERFYRSCYSKDREGIGIGLALSKAIIEKHGGTITVQSELGEGTTFHLIFPKLTNL